VKEIRFTKCQATGNDFIILDRITRPLPIAAKKLKDLVRTICDRKWSVGADGVLVLEKSKKADFRFRIFNPDGTEAQMCGNGSRCVVLYAARTKIASSPMKVETRAGILDASVHGDIVKVRLTDPKDIKWNFCVAVGSCPYMVSFVNTGVPHVVHFVNDLDKVDVKSVGADMRYHETFAPKGTNADFVKVVDQHTIRVRTYERGVEDETLACGTGVVASALIAAESEKLKSPITVITQGGEKLTVHFEKRRGHFTDVFLEGRAALVFEGTISY